MNKSIFFALAFLELFVAFIWWCNGEKVGVITNLAMGIGFLVTTMIPDKKDGD